MFVYVVNDDESLSYHTGVIYMGVFDRYYDIMSANINARLADSKKVYVGTTETHLCFA